MTSDDEAAQPKEPKQFPRHMMLYERLKPQTAWTGGRITDTDLLTLDEAASMATRHAGEPISVADILRAGARGEIRLHAVVRGDLTMTPTRANDRPLKVPPECILPLPVEACRQLANVGAARWQTYEDFERDDGMENTFMFAYTRWAIPDGQPAFDATVYECRVKGYDTHALADAFKASDSDVTHGLEQAEQQGEPPPLDRGRRPKLGTAANRAESPDSPKRSAGAPINRGASGDAVTDYIASINVEAAQTYWVADELPQLTASALCPCEPEPDPIVLQSELRRMTETKRDASKDGQELSKRDLAEMSRRCEAAGLPPLPNEAPSSAWGQFLDACNSDADTRGWTVAILPYEDPGEPNRLKWASIEDEHRKLLKRALLDGTVRARIAGTLIPATMLMPLKRLVLTRSEAQAFCDLLAIKLTDAPEREGPAPVEAAPATCATESADDTLPTGRTGIRWTDERLKELSDYRKKHGTKKAAEHFGVSQQLVRRMLPKQGLQKGFSAFNQKPK